MRCENTVACPQCEEEFTTWGSWSGDGWNEPREWWPDDEDELCPRCSEGSSFTISFKVVGYEDFSKLAEAKEWVEFFDCFDNVYIKSLEVKADD